MPRPIITTSFTPRVKPVTQYSRPRQGGLMNLTCDTTLYTCDTILITCDATQIWMPLIDTLFSRPRYAAYVQDLTWSNVVDLSWELVEWISGTQVNKINTIYT